MKAMMKNAAKRLCAYVLILTLVLGSCITFSNAESLPSAENSAMRDLFFRILSMDTAQREAWIENVLNKFNIDNYDLIKKRTEELLGITIPTTIYDDALKTLLQNGVALDRETFAKFIRRMAIPSDIYNTSGFPGIASTINRDLTGNSTNDKGIKFVVLLLNRVSVYYDQPVAFDDPTNKYLIKFKFDTNKITDTAKRNDANLYIFGLNLFLSNTQMFSYLDIYTFDGLLNQTTTVVNRYPTLEIYEFKKFLKAQSSSIYSGTLEPPINNTPIPTNTPTNTPVNTPVNTPTNTPVNTPTIKPSTSPVATPTSTAQSTTQPGYTTQPGATATPTTKPSTSPTTTAPTTAPTATTNPSAEKVITSFKFASLKPVVEGVISEKFHTIRLYVPKKTNVSSLVPTIEFKGASISPASGTAQNFKKTVFYTVTAANGTTVRYKVMVFEEKKPIITETGEEVPSSNGFTDTTGHWASSNILNLLERGLLEGYPDGSVKPNNSITRAEAVVMLVKAAGYEPAEKINLKFKDTNKIPAWATAYVQTGIDKGILKGYEDNTFRASNYITRAEAIVMVLQAFGIEASTKPSTFADDAKIPDWAKKYVSKAKEIEIIKGYQGNLFNPIKNVSRAEMFTMIDKSLDAKNQ